jgi:predicted RND superfamily exporter protein
MQSLLKTIAAHPLIFLIVLLALTGIFVTAIADNASLETNLDAYMPSDHPAFVFSDEAEELFGIEDAVLIAVEHPQSIYNPGSLEKIKGISTALVSQFEQIESGSVTSLYTADNISGSDWGLVVEPFYTSVPQSEEELARLRERVESNEMIYGRIVSQDGTSALVIAEIGADAFDEDFYAELQEFARSYEGPESIYIAGRPVIEGELAKLGPQDMTRMAPLVVIVMAIILLILLRSIRDTIINLVIVTFGTISAFGVMALMEVPVYAVDTMIPVMLIAIGVAYGIHMHNAIHHAAAAEPEISRKDRVDRTLKAMVRPVSMAAVTTAVGFSALMTSLVLPVRYFGLFASVGVLTEMVLALIIFPISILVFGPPKQRRKLDEEHINKKRNADISDGRMSRVLDHPRRILIIAAVVTVLAGAGVTRVWIDTSFLANFQSSSDVVKTDNFVNLKFGGTSTLNVILTADENEAFKDPEVLKLTDRMQLDVQQDESVGASFSLVDFLKRMHMVMHDDQKSWYRVPESQDLVAQYLLLYELSGDPETLDQVVDYDYRRANVTFQLRSDSSAVMEGIVTQIDAYEQQFADLGIEIQFAGSGYKALVFADLLLSGQIISLALSFLIVAVILALLFKNVLVGIVGTVPIALTAIINFGTMGLLGIPLSSATALISSIAVGIGVDYAIHLIEHYRISRREGMPIREAALETIAHTGRAIIYNAVAVMGGFAVLMLSVFPPNRQVGGLIALNMATSAVGTLTVLVVILVALDRRGKLFPAQKDGGNKK